LTRILLLALFTILILGAEPIADRRLAVTLERLTGEDSWAAVEPGRVLEQGDQVRFRVASNLAGKLYVFNQNAKGSSDLIFPGQGIGDDNAISPESEILLPADGNAFEISGPPGYEVVRWVVSPEDQPLAQADINRFLAPPQRARPQPPMLSPSCDDTILRSRSVCLDPKAGAWAMEGARGIEVGGDETTAVVSATATATVDGVLVFEYRIAHR
jgi:hypothetical protein